GITDYDYDPAGNLLSRTDARGVEATYQYDAENRLTQIDYPAHDGQPAETLSFSYDDSSNGNAGKGRLTAISDGSGNTRFTYDSHGRVTAKTQTVGGGSPRTLQTSYLANGRVEGHVLPSGAVCRYSYRADGRVLSISVNGVEIVSEIDYFAFGEIRSWDYGNSGQYRREFDQDGRIREHSAGSASRSIGFDPASRITAIADNSGARHDWSFDYDDLDRLSSAQNSASQGPVAGTDLLWDYDPTGNRTTQTNAGTPLSYSIDPNSNRLLQVGGNARQYDEVGNTVNDGNGITSTYSPRSRLIQTTNAGLSTTYAHNGFGERVCKAIDSSQACASSTDRIEYVYDDSGHLIGEYPVGGSTAQAVEYVWLDDTPIVVLQRRPGASDGGASGGGTATAWNGTVAGGVDVYYLHPDHLDTPRVVVNAQNQEIWRWDASPFGDTLADEQPTGGLPSYTHNLRFPGQQYDRETGAHYNYFRDYEAGSGRYL
ncbi:MAG: RHS repeat protein, partial [Anaerolineae bacterium]|nr:RHS repeat protein [Anaerolineae bacterium]